MGENKGTSSGGLDLFYATEYRNKTIYEILVANQPPYKTVKYRVVEDPDGDPCMYLLLYLENFAKHNGYQQTSIAEWAGSIVQKIRDAGIPCYIMRASEEN